MVGTVGVVSVLSSVVADPISSLPHTPHLTPGVAFWRTSSILRGVTDHRDLDGSISPPRRNVEAASRSPALTYGAAARGSGEIWTCVQLEFRRSCDYITHMN